MNYLAWAGVALMATAWGLLACRFYVLAFVAGLASAIFGVAGLVVGIS